MNPPVTTPSAQTQSFRKIDHIAIAVRDLEPAITYFTEVLGFSLVRRLEVRGKRTGMLSAELEHCDIRFVLCQGTEQDSQVSKLVANFGPGVAHIALAVDDARAVAEQLEKRGMCFDTSVIEGAGLRQTFTKRDANSGLSFEIIERTSEQGFLEENVRSLFEQLENAGAY
jgi:methylmalonyl-CoA/ethylmalonyl-CoA epimerase